MEFAVVGLSCWVAEKCRVWGVGFQCQGGLKTGVKGVLGGKEVWSARVLGSP